MSPRLTPAQRAARLHKAEWTTREIAAELGVTQKAARRLLDEAGVPPRQRGTRPLPVDTDEIADLAEANVSMRAIAAEVGMSEHGVRNRLARAAADQSSGVDDEELLRLRQVEGLSWAKLGVAAGMSQTGARARYLRLIR